MSKINKFRILLFVDIILCMLSFNQIFNIFMQIFKSLLFVNFEAITFWSIIFIINGMLFYGLLYFGYKYFEMIEDCKSIRLKEDEIINKYNTLVNDLKTIDYLMTNKKYKK